MTRVGQLFREQLSKNLKDGLNNKKSVFILSYSRMKGLSLSNLRKDLKKAGADVFVAKNAITRLALKDLKHDALIDKVSDQTAVVLSDADSVEVSKVLVKFAKEFENLKVQGGLLEGRILEQGDVKKLSDLPSKEVLYAQLLGILQAPVSRLLGAMNGKSRELLSILKQYSEKKGGS